MKVLIDIVKKKSDAVLPEKKTEGAAGFDLYACVPEPVTIEPQEIKMISTGIAIHMLEKSCTAFVFARSGLASKYGIGLANGVGVVDNDYRGEIFVPLYNMSKNKYTVMNGDRIAQMVVMSVCDLEIQEKKSLQVTDRNENGFGSTGR